MERFSQPSWNDLLAYFRDAAEIMGRSSKGAEDGSVAVEQAPYSLLWYYENCLQADLSSDPRSPTLLAAYLGKGSLESLSEIMPEEHIESTMAALEKCDGAYPPNEKQAMAVCRALYYPISFIKGPPGTGKTATIMHIAAVAISQGKSVAVVSTNRSAVDNIDCFVEKLRKDKQRHEVNGLLYQAAQKHVSLGSAGKREKAVNADGEPLGFASGSHEFDTGISCSGWEQHHKLRDFTHQYPFITSTIHSLKKCFVDGEKEKFDYVIIDEASQANIVTGILAMTSARKLIIVGDEDQLPPVVTTTLKSELASQPSSIQRSLYDITDEDRSFLSSCYQVFCEREDVKSNIFTMLTKHYRCHPFIIGFCNKEIYDEQLEIAEKSEGEQQYPICIRWYEGDYAEKRWEVNGAPSSKRDENPPHSSRVNCKQLSILSIEERPLIESFQEQEKSICFLSPFRAQVKLLQKLLDTWNVKSEMLQKEDFEGLGGPNEPFALTIHKAQGREFDIIYLLPVEDGNWEWPWSQGKRLVNVAASRAKEELRVIVSTKMLNEKLQKELTNRVTPAKSRANDANDISKQHMYVRKLVQYVYRKNAQTKDDPNNGLVKSRCTSVFDFVPFIKGASNLRGGLSSPEKCIDHTLGCLNYPNLSYSINLEFSHIVKGDGCKPLANFDLCEKEYKEPSIAHFDFAVFDTISREIVLAIEVDGPPHRGGKNDWEVAHQSWTNDRKKDKVVRDICGASIAVLGNIAATALFQWGFWDDQVKEGSYLTPDTIVEKPEDLKDSSFVLLRIASDGSTFRESRAFIETCNDASSDDQEPPTIEDYIDRQISLSQRSSIEKIYVAEGVESYPMVPQPSGCLSITKCLQAWKKQPEVSALINGITPKSMNDLLDEAGYQTNESDYLNLRRPTQKGSRIGMKLAHGWSKNGPFTYSVYSKQAQKHILERLDKIIESAES